MKKPNPFDECPVYETANFRFTLVCEDDAEDLFVCYSDPVTLSHMNNDNCGGEWRPQSSDELKHAWQKDYERRTFLRWTIKDKTSGTGIGTIEIAPLPWGRWFFGDETPIGILRLDIISRYETEDVFAEITAMMCGELARDFEVNQVIMKAPPNEPERCAALMKNGFAPSEIANFPFEHYYSKSVEYAGTNE
jgi:hypothetical protein